jgi:hypothetical protein
MGDENDVFAAMDKMLGKVKYDRQPTDALAAEMLAAIDDAASTRDTIVPLYVRLIHTPGSARICPLINGAIMDRWSQAALHYIKERAWRAER